MRIINSELNGAGRTSEAVTDLEKLNFKTDLFVKNHSGVFSLKNSGLREQLLLLVFHFENFNV